MPKTETVTEPAAENEQTDPQPEPEAQPDPQPEPESQPDAEAGAESDDFPEPDELPEDQDTFDREYVEKLRQQAADYRVKAKAAKEFNDPDEAQRAAKVWNALQTEEGVAQLFVEAGQALGLNTEQLEALFGEDAPTTPAPETSDEPEEEETEIQRLEREIEELKKTQTQTVQEQRQAVAKSAAQEALTELGLDPENKDNAEVINQVLTLGQNHLAEDEWSPDKIKAAVKKGHEELQKVVEKRAAELLKQKKETADNQPGSIDGGSPPGGEPVEEPKNMKEAKAMARKSLGIE